MLSQTPCGVPTHARERPDVAVILKKSRELLHRKPHLSNERPKGSFCEFFMVGNGQAPVRRVGMPENDVAAMLLIEFVSKLSECLHGISAGNHRQLHPL